MTVRFLVDAQLPPALARHIAALGHDSDHVADVGLLAASDQEIWQHAEAIVESLMRNEQVIEMAEE